MESLVPSLVSPMLTPVITPIVIHQLWRLIEETQASALLKLDDATLIQWLTQQLSDRQHLSQEEERATRLYIKTRLPLIREMA
jgi:hypothetical protein